MNKKIILSSILSLVLCISLIAGGTFALFTSESKTNISVTSGKVDVKATFAIDSVYSPMEINTDATISDDANGADISTNTFKNGGTVAVDGADVTITNMTPGDKVIFAVTITNNSNVEFLQRLTITPADADKSFFNELLVGLYDAEAEEYKYYSDYATDWEVGTPVSEPATEVAYLSVEMPAFVGNNWQNKSCSFTLAVNAVQGNAATVGEAIDNEITMVGASELAAAIENAADGDVIFLTEPAGDISVSFADAKEVTVRGHYISALTVDAPEATVNVYNNVGILTGVSVAQKSLHIFGEIANIVINSGRLVIENTAKVEEVKIAPAENAKVALFIPETVVEENVLVAEVAAIIVDEVKSGATVKVTVSAAIGDEIVKVADEAKDSVTVHVGDKEPADSYVEDTENKILSIGDADGLRKFAANVNDKKSYANWTVNLIADIDLAGENWTPIYAWEGILNGAVIDGNGYTIKNMKMDGGDIAGFISVNASSLTVKNLTFDNAYVKTTDGNGKYAGVVIGKNYSNVNIDGVNIINSQVRCTWQSGGFVGFAETNAPVFTNSTIKDSFVGGSNCTSGAFFGLGIVDITMTGCVAENVDLYTDMDAGFVGYIYGKTLTATDCTMMDVVAVSTYPAE